MDTFLMTDVVGSTSLWERFPAAMATSLARHDDIIRSAVDTHRGTVFKHTGDGMIAVFAEVGDAIGAASDAMEMLASEAWGETGPLAVRASIHVGEANRRAGDYFGTPVNRVSRINSVGHPGQILISDAARRLVEEWHGLDMGLHQLRDLSAPVHLWQVGTTEHPPLRSLSATRHSLPIQLTEFVGRDTEVSELTETLYRQRLVTIAGIGGCGKTRLAIEVAATLTARFPGGVWFVDLSALRDEQRVGAAVMTALGLPEARALDPEAMVATVSDVLGRRPSLLVLDNCEHLVDGVAEFVQAVLARSPEVHVLATSREPLAIPGEHVWRIPVLEAASVEMFVLRAQAAGATGLDPTDPTIASICAALDHIPLAIELAAPQAAYLAPGDLFARLDGRLDLLGGRRSRRRDGRTLRTMMEWSYELLDDDERQLLTELAVFTGSFSLDAAAAVWSRRVDAPVVEVMESLVAQSVVVPIAETGRFRLIETVRLFARERLDEAGDTRAAEQRFMAWVQSFCGYEQVHDRSWTEFVELSGRQNREAVAYQQALDLAAARDDVADLADLIYGGWSIFLIDQPQRGLELISRLEPPTADVSRLLDHLGCETYCRFGIGDYDGAMEPGRRSFELVSDLAGSGSLPLLAPATIEIYGYLLTVEKDFVGARSVLALLTDLAAEESEPAGASISRDTLAVDVHFNLGDLDEVAEAVERLGANIDRVVPGLVGLVWFFTARLELAREHFEAALVAAEQASRHESIAEVRSQVPELTGLALVGCGRFAEAIDVFRADRGPQFELFRQYERDGRIAGLVALNLALGRRDDALVWLRALRDLCHPVEAPYRFDWMCRVAGGERALAALPSSRMLTLDADAAAAAIDQAYDEIDRLVGRGSASSALPVRAPWFHRSRVDDSTRLIVEPAVTPLLRCNMWHVVGRDADLLVDAGIGVASLTESFDELASDRITAVATHGHRDHIGGMSEFARRAMHPLDAHSLAADDGLDLDLTAYAPSDIERYARWGYDISAGLLTAVPSADFDLASARSVPTEVTRCLRDGDVIDLGDRAFEVIHLPGHTPGSIGLWDERTGTLFSGDAVYDGPLLDEDDGSDIDDYVATMERLRSLPVQVVHGGHGDSMGRSRFREIIDGYLRRRG